MLGVTRVGSSLSFSAETNLVSTLSTRGAHQCGESLSAFSDVTMRRALSVRNCAAINRELSVGRVPNIGSICLSILGDIFCGSSLLSRSYVRLGSSLSVISTARLGANFSVQSVGRVGVELSILGQGSIGSAISVAGADYLNVLSGALSCKGSVSVRSSVSLLSFVRISKWLEYFWKRFVGDGVWWDQ